MQQENVIEVDVFIGVDVAKADHYACVITSGGDQVLARAVRNDETAVAALFDAAAAHGSPALMIDTTSSTAALLMHAAAQRGLPVALRHRPGHAPRRGAVFVDAGAAKTDT